MAEVADLDDELEQLEQKREAFLGRGFRVRVYSRGDL